MAKIIYIKKTKIYQHILQGNEQISQCFQNAGSTPERKSLKEQKDWWDGIARAKETAGRQVQMRKSSHNHVCITD